MKVAEIIAEIDKRMVNNNPFTDAMLMSLRDWIIKNQSRKGYDKAYYAKNKTRIKVRNSK